MQVKSRMMGSSSTAYKGTVDCFVQTLKNDVHLPFPSLCFFPSTSLLCFDMAEKSYLRSSFDRIEVHRDGE
jgi:hypothetical protein